MATKTFTFYGTEDSLLKWREIIAVEFNILRSRIYSDDGRLRFNVNLNNEQRDYLQIHYWHKVEDDCDMPWAWRVAYSVEEF